MIVGGAGSGKTAAVAIPTLMSWKERVFAIDIKGELYAKTIIYGDAFSGEGAPGKSPIRGVVRRRKIRVLCNRKFTHKTK